MLKNTSKNKDDSTPETALLHTNISGLHNTVCDILFLDAANFSSIFNEGLEGKLTALAKHPNSVPRTHVKHSHCL